LRHSARTWPTDQYLDNLPADDGRIARGLWGANHEQLVAIKRRYDPDNTFRLNHDIDPLVPAKRAAPRIGRLI
jgi:hypothetical protein